MGNKKQQFEGEIRRGWIWAAMFFILAITIIFLTQSVVYGAGGRLLPIYSVETPERKIALTFNCAWGTEDVPEILSVLEKYGAKATFFMVGSWAEQNPEAAKLIAKAGHEVGSHSNTHPDMTTLSRAEAEEELQRSSERIFSACGEKPVLFRAPSGAYNNEVITVAAEQGLVTIQWNVDSRDWKNPTVEKMVTSVTENVQNGSIVLFHCGAQPTAEALPQIMEILYQQGYAFVSVSDLIYKSDYTIDNSGRQISLRSATQ